MSNSQARKVLADMKEEIKRVCPEIAAEMARQGMPASKILREVYWQDGVGNVNSMRLRATGIGLPSYCLEIFPGGEVWLEDDGITELARFFKWLDKHAARERIMLCKRQGKIEYRVRKKFAMRRPTVGPSLHSFAGRLFSKSLPQFVSSPKPRSN